MNYIQTLTVFKYLLLRILFKLRILRNFDFFIDYFQTLNLIKAGQNPPSIWLATYSRQIILLTGLHEILGFFAQTHCSRMQNFALYNSLYIHEIDRYWALLIAFFILASVYGAHLLYFDNFGFSTRVLYAILVKQRSNGLFLWPTVVNPGNDDQQLRDSNYESRIGFGGGESKLIVESIRVIAVWAPNSFRIFYLFNCKKFV